MVMWEAFGVLLLSPTGISRCPGVRTATLTGTKDSFERSFAHFVCLGFFFCLFWGLVVIVVVVFFYARSCVLCHEEVWCCLLRLVLSLPVGFSPSHFCQVQAWACKSTPPSPAPLCRLCPGTLSNSSHTSHGSNFKKARADTDITTAFLPVTYLGLHLFS